MPVLRWLLPLVAALALVGQSVAAWAAAGTFGAASCCCPQPQRCKCHDHGDSRGEPELRRCSGEAERVAPAPIVAAPAPPPVSAGEPVLAAAAPPPPPPALPARHLEPPEPPPF